MSWEIVAPAFKTKLGNNTAKLILLVICNHCNEEGSCFPSLDYIADRTELSRRQVMRVMQVFGIMGLVTREAVTHKRYKYAWHVDESLLGQNLTDLFKKTLDSVREKDVEDGVCPKDTPTKVSQGHSEVTHGQIPHTPYKEESPIESPTLFGDTQSKTKKAPRERKPKSSETDPRHQPIKQEIAALWMKNNPGARVPEFYAPEGNALSRLLRERPNWTVEEALRCVRNRFASEENHSEQPRAWIKHLPNYFRSPLDRFGKPLVATVPVAAAAAIARRGDMAEETRRQKEENDKYWAARAGGVN